MTVLLVAAALCFEPAEAGLDGLWHAMPCVGSGYAEIYAFFSDGSFVWRENGMDGEARLRERGGCWLLEGDTLLLAVDSEIRLEGGELVPAAGSTGTDSELTGFKTMSVDYPFPETLRLPVSGPCLEEAASNQDLPVDMWRILIGGEPFWRLSDDPVLIREILTRGY